MKQSINLTRTRKLVILAMMAALAYIVMAVCRIPVVLFLKYEPKDIIIAFAGLIYGPLSSLAVSLVVSFAEMITVSDTGIIGMVMNVISTCAFTCTAAYIYKKQQTLRGAVIGLVTGMLFSAAAMLLWNYIMVPLYTPSMSREAVAGMLLPAFLPFNLLKGGINVALTLLLYKPLVRALRAVHMLPEKQEAKPASKGVVGVMLASVAVLLACVLIILVLQGVL